MYEVATDFMGGICITRLWDNKDIYLQPGDDASAYTGNPADYF